MLVCLSAAPASVCAQGRDSLLTVRAEEVLVRVRRYTSSDVAQARALADSLVSALPADASVLPEALFAKASIAASASDAERDYARIVDQHHFAPRVPDALMRLALLESARNNRAGALRRLEQLLRDHGDAPVRSRASLLAGRLRMEANDPARACELLAAAYVSAGNAERDVREQAVSLGARCPVSIVVMAERDPTPMGVLRAPRDGVMAAATAPVTSTPSPAQLQAQAEARRRRQRDSVQAAQREQRAQRARQAAAATAAREAALIAARAAQRDSVVPPVAAPPARSVSAAVASSAPTPAPAPTRAATPVAIAPVTRDPPPPTTEPQVATIEAPAASAVSATRTAAATPAAIPTAVASRFAVQFAAYNDRAGAEQLAKVLQGRGITARVEGTAKPFRVRAGRFTTRGEAEASAAVWRRPGQAAMVVEYGPTP